MRQNGDVLLILCVSLVFSHVVCKDVGHVHVNPGENVTLECLVPDHVNITVLKWIRPDLKPAGYVLFYRDEQVQQLYQHPSFFSRVQLRDPQMSDGDVSVILIDVGVNDTGTYEGHVSRNGARRGKRAQSELRCIIHLDVGHQHQDAWFTQIAPFLQLQHLVVYATIAAVVVLTLTGAVCVVIVKRRRNHHPVNEVPSSSGPTTSSDDVTQQIPELKRLQDCDDVL